MKTHELIEILNTLESNQILTFIKNYEEETKNNPFLYKHFNQRIRQIPFEYHHDENSSEKFFLDNEEFLKIIDKLSDDAKKQFEKNLKTFYILFQNISNIPDYILKIETLENIGIDTITFGFKNQRRNIVETINSNNLKTYIKTNNKKVENLKIYSNGFIKNPKLYVKTTDQTKITGCTFDLETPSFILESKNEEIKSNHIYLLGSTIDLENILPLPNLYNQSFEFNEEITELFNQIHLEQYNYETIINYPNIEGKTPKQLYR